MAPPPRKPLIAGNWKMNLNHLEAIALTQKIAFSLKEEHLAAVEVVVLPPFVDLRSVQTLVDGDRLLIGYGAQDLSPYDCGAYTGDISGAMLAKLGCTYVARRALRAASSTTARTTPWSTPRSRRRSGTASCRSSASARRSTFARPASHIAALRGAARRGTRRRHR